MGRLPRVNHFANVPPRRDGTSLQRMSAEILGIEDTVADEELRPAQPKGLAVRQQEQHLQVSDGRMALGRFEMTRVGMIIPEDTSVEEWTQARDMVIHWDDASQWWLGDLLAFGKRKYKEGYKLVAAKTGKEIQTLRNYVYVASRVDLYRRRYKLSFGHHEAVAKLDPADQDAWLSYAEQEELSVSQLRAALRGEKPQRAPSAMPPEIKAHLVYLGSLTGIPYDRTAKEELRERIHQARAWLDALEEELDR